MTASTLLSQFEPHAPNKLQILPLYLIAPSADNVRLFVEHYPLADLVNIYTAHLNGADVVLPDAPIVRFTEWVKVKGKKVPKLECLAGERRLTAANIAGLEALPVRCVTLSDREAYDFIMRHNDVKPLTTIELAFRAAEMERLGYTLDEIGTAIKGVGLDRYLCVGRMVDPQYLTDNTKLCDPSITVWYEAAKQGKAHFKKCLIAWDRGIWNSRDCDREFRKKGVILPPDPAERGFRVTLDRHRLLVRGTVDLTIHDGATAKYMIEELQELLETGRTNLISDGRFSDFKEVLLVNPLTLAGA